MSTEVDTNAPLKSTLDKVWSFIVENGETILTDLTTELILVVVGLFFLALRWVHKKRLAQNPAPREQLPPVVDDEELMDQFVSETMNRSVQLSFGLALTPPEGSHNEGAPEITLDQIWTPLRVADSQVRAEKTGTHENMAEGDQGIPLEPFLYESEDDLIVLGEPGSGKSTSLAATAYHFSSDWSSIGDKIAIWVTLASVRESDDLDEVGLLLSGVPEIGFLAKKFGTESSLSLKSELRKAISSGSAILLLDGLDEVKEFRLDAVKKAITFIKRKHRTSKVIVTCRAFDYRQQIPNRKLPFEHELELLPYDSEQQQSYVESWYSAAVSSGRLTVDEASPLCAALIVELKTPDVGELGASPLLLALLTMIHSEEAKLPDSRAVLCDKAVEYMLADAAKWRFREAGQQTTATPPVISLAIDVAHAIHVSEEDLDGASPSGISSREVLNFARKICEQMKDAEPTRNIPSAENLAKRLLNSHGLLVETSEDTYEFSHRSFQEFLAGQYYAAGAHDEEALNYAAKLHWREPFRLLASFAGHEGNNLYYVVSLITRLVRTENVSHDFILRTLLGAEMLAEIGKRRLALHKYERVYGEPISGNVGETGLWGIAAEILHDQVEDEKMSLAERDRAGVILGQLGDPRIISPNGESIFENAVPIQGGLRKIGTDRLDPADLRKTGGFLGGIRMVQLPDFKISRYPITNHEFGTFIEDGGYQNPEFWNGRLAKGWMQGTDSVLDELRSHWIETLHLHHEKEINAGEISLEDTEREASQRIAPRNLPYYWNDRRFSAANQPVVGINFWEAKAYCAWATENARTRGWINEYECVALPTEFEWEAASRPIDDDRIFPWGDNWDESKAHVRTNLLNLRQPTPVGVYLENWDGGPCEMAGNVWEWTDSLFVDFDETLDAERQNDDSLEQRVVRGSSWQNNPIVAACGARAVDRSYNLFYDVGFRVIIRV
ncbi:SUMF1/EgtB/PvdO family nonheme iron enzyme (plasmid) [Aliisedimentitalea scapharcae]|uniref:SUMF1/EgtB/PvdO family nonheme iron enzyme n=1 Tax=Aliisedimentitalea scapharcae TaxID=1524259 RepID=A0ABZ2Y0U6_9RHOB